MFIDFKSKTLVFFHSWVIIFVYQTEIEKKNEKKNYHVVWSNCFGDIGLYK